LRRKNSLRLLIAFIEVKLKTAVLILGVHFLGSGGFHVGDGAEDFQGLGLDPAAVGVFHGHRQLEDFSRLKGPDGILAFLGAVALVDDEQLVLQGVAFEVVESLRGETAEEVNVLGRHERSATHSMR